MEILIPNKSLLLRDLHLSDLVFCTFVTVPMSTVYVYVVNFLLSFLCLISFTDSSKRKEIKTSNNPKEKGNNPKLN